MQLIALKNLLKPEITRDSSFKVEKFSNKEKELITKWGIKDDNGISYIPGLDEIFQVHGAQKKKGYYPGVKITKDKKGLHNHKFHGYWDDMVSLYDKMYAQLNILIDQCNYFKQEISY